MPATTLCVRLLLTLLFLSNLAIAEELTLERLEGSPDINGEKLANLEISPDGTRVTYLKGKETDKRQLDLWEYNVAAKAHQILVDSQELLGTKEILSEEEKSRRERQRIMDSGIIDYFWDAEGKALLFPLGGDIYYKPLNGTTRRLTNTQEFETDLNVSPKGNYVSFIRNQNVYIIDLKDGKEKQLTFDGKGLISNGVAEFVAQEEMGRYTGYWWSPDDSYIAFTQIDETPVKLLNRYEIAADGGVTVIPQRYPQAGTSNVLIRLGIITIKTGQIQWLDLGPDQDIYLVRVNWLPDSKHLSFQRQTRDQKKIDLIFADIKSGTQKAILAETSKTWINLSNDLTFLKNSNEFLWTSERDGFRHIYLYSLEGRLIRQVTSGKWPVLAIEKVDEKNQLVYFQGLLDTPLEKHFYSISLQGGAPQRLTHEEGSHYVKVPEHGSVFVDLYSSSKQPWRTFLKDFEGKTIAVISNNLLDKSHPYFPFIADHATAEIGTLNADDGTTLYYSLTKPPRFDSSRKYPVIVDVYGGPTAQDVANFWHIGFNQYLARKGYIVFQLDNRGTTNRGKSFEDVLYRKMADVEVQDQLRGVNFLKTLPYVDQNRIGVFGWSYGGFMTLHLLMKGSGIFKAGVSGAPVTDFRLYDTHYTERYLGNPLKDEEAYKRSSVFPYLDDLKGDLLLIHGMADDNVIFDNSVRLMTEFEKRGILFELMTYPGERHGIYGVEQGLHRWKTIFDFFERKLKGNTEPAHSTD